MTVREFNGTSSDEIQWAIGGLSAMTFGTWAAILKPTSAASGTVQLTALHSTGPTWRVFWGYNSANNRPSTHNNVEGFSDGATSSLDDDRWQLVVYRKATGSATPRWSIWDYTDVVWNHNPGSTALSNWTAAGAGGTVRMSFQSSSEWFQGRLAVVAAWSDSLPWTADAAGDTAIEGAGLHTALANWIAAGPTALWAFNQASTATPVDDIIGAADQSAIAGTTVVVGDDPPGFTFDLAVPARTAGPGLLLPGRINPDKRVYLFERRAAGAPAAVPVDVTVDPADLALTGLDVAFAGSGAAALTADVGNLYFAGETVIDAGAPSPELADIIDGGTPDTVGTDVVDGGDPGPLMGGVEVQFSGSGSAPLPVDPGDLVLTGVDVAVAAISGVTVDPATLTLTGIDVAVAGTGVAAFTVDPGGLTVTGVDVGFAGGPVAFTVDPAALSVVGVDVAFAGSAAATLVVDPAILSLAGVEVGLAASGAAPLAVDPGPLTFTGVDVALAGSGVAAVTVDVGLLTLTGVDVPFTTSGFLSVDPGALTLTGLDVAFAGSGAAAVTVDPGALVLTAVDVSLAGTGAAAITVDPAALTLTAVDVSLAGTGAAGLPVDPAVLTLTGLTPVLAGTGTGALSVDPGVLVLGAVDVVVTTAGFLSVDPGLLAITGVDVAFAGTGVVTRTVDIATLSIVGVDVGFASAAGSLAVDPGLLALEGRDVTFGASSPATFPVDTGLLVLTAVEVLAVVGVVSLGEDDELVLVGIDTGAGLTSDNGCDRLDSAGAGAQLRARRTDEWTLTIVED